MSNNKQFTEQLRQQQGISLVVSLIMLLIITVIGISAMDNSISKLKMTGGSQRQSLAANDAEETLVDGEQMVDSGAYSGTDAWYFDSETEFREDTSWANANTVPHADNKNDNEYIIEYLGETPIDGETSTVGSGSGTAGSSVHVYRVTARSTTANETTRMFQSLYFSENGPPN